jgi:hypothetical protein
MGPSFRISKQHGNLSVTVRGTVTSVTSSRRRFWLFNTYPKVAICIDEDAYCMLLEKFGRRDMPRPDMNLSIIWGADSNPPAVNERVWVQFAYAGELEQFFQGAPPLSLLGVERLTNEAETREDELVATDQLPLPHLQTA